MANLTKPFAERFRAFVRDDEGPTAIEYALMAAAVAGIIVAVVMFLGARVNNTFRNVTERYPGE